MSHTKGTIVASAVLAAVAASSTVPAQAAGPQSGTFGNIPAGAAGSTAARQNLFADQTLDLLKRAGKNDRVYVGMYSISIRAIAEEALAADRRGAVVVWVTFYNSAHPIDGMNAFLRDGDDHQRGLGTTKGSRFVACHNACGGNGDTQHLKVTAGYVDGEEVWISGTGNDTHSALKQQWNQWTVARSKVLTDQARDKVLRMASQKTDNSCSTVTDPKLKITVTYTPCKSPVNPALDFLQAVRCKKGDRFGMAMFMAGPSADKEIDEVIRISKGCATRLVVNPNHWSKKLLKRLQAAHVPMRDSRHGDRYGHGKDIWVDAHDSHSRKLQAALSGSATLGVVSRRDNENNFIRQEGQRIVDFNSARLDREWADAVEMAA